MYKRFQLFTPVIVALMVLSCVLVTLTVFFNMTLFYISGAVALLVFAAVLGLLRQVNKRTRLMLEEITDGILYTGQGDYINFPLPVLTIYDGSEIIWYNQQCADRVFGGLDLRGEDVGQVLPALSLTPKSPWEGQDITWENRRYTAYVADARSKGQKVTIVYLIDDTQLKQDAGEYHAIKPSVALIMVDNYDELIQDYRDSERAQLMSEIEDAMGKYIARNSGFFVRIERDKFLAVLQERGLETIVQSKFDLLDQVRGMNMGGRMGATLSIGVGREAASLSDAESMARQALDMCLGRGGDQVAIKTQNGYDFYGGVSKGVEKRTKVKTRIIASALAELIESSENVVVMGHRFADLDCLGSCVGMWKSVKAMERPVVICMNREKSLVESLLLRLDAGGFPEEDFRTPEQVLPTITDKTLLIVLDTHVPQVLESEAVYRACKNVVVIDHHRKLVSYIDNAVIFYHEPYASSASEMVTELIQYFPVHPRITKLEAEALLAGIMLDTKNFILRTGVRTFEAAAYLRRLGADTVEVRKLFTSSMDNYQQKSSIVSAAEIYSNCAIAMTDEQYEGIKVIAPQAADELMSIAGVDASFVIFQDGTTVGVSARSMGTVNVQIIMEKLGGGGHHTMAAAQFPGESMENIRRRVMEGVDEYYASLAQPTNITG